MDVRCEKCQTEYELDETRLKPGGVTVKCTNCGHMFKIRKRSPTNVGLATNGGAAAAAPTAAAPVAPAAAPAPAPRARQVSSKPPGGISDGAPSRAASELGSGPNAERQWLIRLENGEQKTCRELATLQQWIVAGVVTREALISRAGKTWKRLGDITELGQYFTIADEARSQRSGKPTGKQVGAPTMLGMKPSAAGGTVLPDDDDRATGPIRARGRTTPPPPPPPRTPPSGTPLSKGPASPDRAAASGSGAEQLSTAQTELAPAPTRRTPTQPPPMPRAKLASAAPGERAWAAADIKPSQSMASMPQGPSFGGKRLAAIPDEPAFAGRVRVRETDERMFDTGKVRMPEDDDYLPARSGSRVGLWIAIVSILVIAGAAGATYLFVFKDEPHVATKTADAHVEQPVAVAPADASVQVTPLIDAPPPLSPLEAARAELATDIEAKLRTANESLATADDPPALALRARLTTAIAQALVDRAGLVDKTEGDKLRKDAKQLVIDAAPLAQRALKAAGDDPAASLAMADVLRLQAKPARDVHRYLDAARAKQGDDKDLVRSIALCDAQLLARDGKLGDAAKLLTAIAEPDARVELESALVALAQNHAADAKPIVEQLLAKTPDQEVARALDAKLATLVAKTDPLPPEDGKGSSAPTHPTGTTPVSSPNGGGGESYDVLVERANKLAETNCAAATELFEKALLVRSNGVEALTGQGYCYLDAKRFSSALSSFRAALLVSPRYEPALAGIAEMYQQQGNHDMAIAKWKEYLDVYPSSQKAKKQLELLGVTDATPGSGSAPAPAPAPAPVPAPAPPAPAPTATPTPTPTPAATPGAAAGSGSN